MKTILEVLQSGTDYLSKQGCEEARAVMQHLMAHVLQCNRTALYSQFDRPIDEAQLAPLRALLKRKAAGEPLQHLLGTTEFYRREFLTDARALIPRPETEELVEKVLSRVQNHPVRVLDMGTGSGIIGITMALELGEKAKEVVLADISEAALSLALENALRLGARVSTVQTDLFENLPNPAEAPAPADEAQSPADAATDATADALENTPSNAAEAAPYAPLPPKESRFDIIIANLPYIADDEPLSAEVLRDPHTALFGGPNGWEIIERFLSKARDYLTDDGFVALEIGYDQADIVTQMMDGYGYDYIEVLKDMSGIARFPFAHR